MIKSNGGSGAGTETVTGAVRWSPAWCLVDAAPTELVLSAGADRVVVIDGVRPEHLDAVRSWAAGSTVADQPDADGGPIGPLIDRLVEVGALVPAVPSGRLAVGLVADPAVGEELAVLLATDADLQRDVGVTVVAAEAADLALVVRSGRDWPAGRRDLPAEVLHLGVDLSLHHTVVLGPLVVPGASACLDCLDRRERDRWGPPAVPDQPAAGSASAVVAALLAVQLRLVASAASPLINVTIAWDLEQGRTDRAHLYRVTGCHGCRPDVPAPRAALRWAP